MGRWHGLSLSVLRKAGGYSCSGPARSAAGTGFARPQCGPAATRRVHPGTGSVPAAAASGGGRAGRPRSAQHAAANCTVDRSQHQGAVFADVVRPLLAACPNLGPASIKGADPPFQLPARLMQQTSLAELECNNCQLEALPDGPVLPGELPLCLPVLCCCSTCMPASPPRGRGCLWLHWSPSDARCSWLALPHAC